jgi:hypothetical protein
VQKLGQQGKRGIRFALALALGFSQACLFFSNVQHTIRITWLGRTGQPGDGASLPSKDVRMP